MDRLFAVSLYRFVKGVCAIMRKIAFGLILLTFCVGLTSCSTHPGAVEPTKEPVADVIASPTVSVEEEPSQEVTVLPIPEPTEEVQQEPIIMYKGAVEEYLLPIEEYSWEREHKPEYVMIHFTSAVAIDRENPYDMKKIRGIFEDYNLSIHYILDREGTVYCYMPEDRVAWHAGKGTFANDERLTNNMNHYAIGIEIAAMGSQSDMQQYLTAAEYAKLDEKLIGFTDVQYDSLQELVQDLCTRYEIPFDRSHVIGHQDYSPHKTDPGELFDWARLFGAQG